MLYNIRQRCWSAGYVIGQSTQTNGAQISCFSSQCNLPKYNPNSGNKNKSMLGPRLSEVVIDRSNLI